MEDRNKHVNRARRRRVRLWCRERNRQRHLSFSSFERQRARNPRFLYADEFFDDLLGYIDGARYV